MYQILNEPPWYLLALSLQQFLWCDTLSWWVCSPPQLQIFCMWFLGLGECSHWCYRNMGSWCQYLTLWLQIGETPLLTAFSRRVSGSGKMRKKGGQKQSPAERMRGVRVCCCFMYQPINFLLWPLRVTLSFEASLTTPLVWIVSHHQSADLPPRMPCPTWTVGLPQVSFGEGWCIPVQEAGKQSPATLTTSGIKDVFPQTFWITLVWTVGLLDSAPISASNCLWYWCSARAFPGLLMQLLSGETISLLEECSSVLDIQQCSFKGRVLSRSLAQGFPCGGGNIQPSSGGCWQGSDPGQKCEQPESCSDFC